MRVVAYCRYSSEAQRDGYSIEAQTKAITEWCERQGHTILHFYIDEAESATSDDRTEFQRMVKDAASGSFEAVIVHKLDRFARNRYDSAIYKHKLKQNGVRVISMLEPLDDSPESVIMESVLEGMAEYFSKNLARETRKGKREAAGKAQFVGGKPPLGYGVDDKHRFFIIPEEAEIVKEIFKRYASGEGSAAIARDLTSRGIRGRKGSPLTCTSMRFIISNPLYYGHYVWFKNTPAQEPIVVDGVVPAIISQSLFDAANARIEKRGPQRRYEDFILTGYLFPASGSGHYVGSSSFTNYKLKDGTVKRSASEVYIIRGPIKDCPRSMKKSKTEDFIVGSVEAVLFSGATLDWVISELKARLEARAKETAPVDALNTRLRKLQEQKNKLLDLYLSGSVDKAVYSVKFGELGKAEELVKAELKRATAAVPRIQDVEELKSALLSFVHSASADSLEYKKRLLATFVERVTVSNDEIVIYFKFPIPGNGDTLKCDLRNFADKVQNVLTYFTVSAKFPLVAVYACDYSSAVVSINA